MSTSPAFPSCARRCEMASAQAFMTYWMLRLLVKPQIARRWGSQSLDEQRRGYERTAQRWGKLVPGAQVEPITIGLIDAERVVPLSAKPAATRTMSCD
jgi:hypothetical protein